MSMKKVLFILCFLPLAVSAQNNSDTTSIEDKTGEEVKISLDDLTRLNKGKEDAESAYKKLKAKYNKLEKQYTSDSIKYSGLQGKSLKLSKENEDLKNKLTKDDKRFITISSNFLYIPYEAYSVEKIALPAFESVNDSTLRKKYDIRYKLLKSYQNHVRGLLAFLTQTKEELNNPFALQGNGLSVILTKLRQEQFYKDYAKYDDWTSTYIGKNIQKVAYQLKNFKPEKKKTIFADIINDLERCLKSVDSL